MCRECPRKRDSRGVEIVCSCVCGANMVRNGKCERCGHFLDFYKPSTIHRHRWSIGESEKVFRRSD